ncbi:hypothetical protein QUF90_19220 [Desulfococcaceae bacterium HSG9]|nr:hypothetical protein [Desulfococcaceae bacterium HSG9]
MKLPCISNAAQYITRFIICTLFGVLLIGISPPALADELEDVLSGFDEQPAETSMAKDDNALESVLSGFDEPAGDAPASGLKTKQRFIPEWLEISGELRLTATVNTAHHAPEPDKRKNTDYRGLSMLRTAANITGDMTFSGVKARIGGRSFYDAAYTLNDRSQYTQQLLDDYETESELTEVWLQADLRDNLDIKTGRQIAVWGRSDNIRVTDILNPLNNRQPGMTDIKDLRLPVAMTELDYYTGDWNLSGIVIHEPRFAENPVYGSDFYPGDSPPPPQDTPSVSLENQQYALALNGIFSGWDLSFYSAYVFDSRSHIETDASGTKHARHGRVFMAGMAGNIASGNWMFKGEAAWWNNLEFANQASQEKSRIDALAAAEYTGFSETVIAFEAANRHLIDYDDALSRPPDNQEEDLFQSVLRVTRDFRNDTVQLKIILSTFGLDCQDGALQRLQLDYDCTDNLTLTGGAVFYQSGDLYVFQNIGDNDRVFLEMSYAF